jgi:MFS family permease
MLLFIVFAPLIAALLILIGAPARQTALLSAAATAGATLVAFFLYDPARAGFQFVRSFPISASWRLQFLLGADGLTLIMLFLAALILLCAVWFCNTLATYGVFLFLPKILQEASGWSGLRLAFITAAPFVLALAGMVLIGRHSDLRQERKWHVVACALTAALGLLFAASFPRSVPLLVAGFALSQLGARAVQGVFWAIPPLFLGGSAAAAGIAMINAVGNLGGFVGPSVVGWLRSSDPGYSRGLLFLAGSLVVVAVLVASLRLPKPEPQAARASGA